MTACPGCGRTTSTTVQELAEAIQGYIRDMMPIWKTQFEGVESMTLAVMGCIVNGPGESKAANIGISLPGTGEAPRCPVYIDGKKDVTLEGTYDELAAAFQALVDNYIAKHYPRKVAESVTNARTGLVRSSVAEPKDDRAIAASVDALGAAELTLAEARADRIAALQSSDAALSPYQIAALVVLGGTLRTTGLAFTEPDPPDVTDHAGYVEAVRQAAANAEAQGFLLPAAANTIVAQAEASGVLN